MSNLIITGWKPGLNKIELTKIIRRYTRLGLAESKHTTDQVLEKKLVFFKDIDLDIAESFLNDLTEVGAVVEIEK
jgi:ribosomal protein L7/L12